MAIYHKKFLADGVTPNPLHKPKKSGKSGKSGKHRPEFLRGNFVAIDGEGETVNGKHVYTLLAARTRNIYNAAGLTSEQCFDFLIQLGRENPHGIFCIFSGSYDANFWLRNVPRETIELIVAAEGKYPIWWQGYGIRYTARRFFTIQLQSEPKARPVRIWDVWGFYQGTFINAVKTWLPGFDKLDLIIRGKTDRTNFTAVDREYMLEYNNAELEALELMMQKLREALIEMGLTLTGWHGAGAVASAIYKAQRVTEHYENPPEPIYTASAHAYFGGRIEIGKYGTHDGTIHHYDINSAYPAVQRNLPSLAGGKWLPRGGNFDTRTTDNICIALVRWSNIVNTPFCPFPYRSEKQRKVLFPAAGLNWIWKPEIDAALKWRDARYDFWEIEILESYEFIPAGDAKPFTFIDDYYSERQKIVAETKRTGIHNGVQMAIKLGLNSLYGKTAQRVGYDPKTGRVPPYHNLVYAGYITAATRAALYDAAMQKPDKIIALATDGIYSTEPLELHCPAEKILGAWEYQRHDAMTLIQSGVYFLRDGDELTSYSRGFDRMITDADKRDTLEKIKTAWKYFKTEVYLPCTRFITLKSAMCGGDWWSRWLTWHEFKSGEEPGRRLAITCQNTKRVLRDTKSRADKYMLQTYPTENVTPDVLSLKHSIPWDCDEFEPDENIVLAEHDESII